MENKENARYEMTLLDLWKVFRKAWYIILLVAIVFGAVAYIYISYFTVPLYSSSSTFYIYYGDKDQSLGTSVGMAQTMAGSYTEFILSNDVIDKMKEDIPELAGYSRDAIRSMIAISSDEEKMIIKVSASHPNARVAYEMIEVVTEFGVEKAKAILKEAGQEGSGISTINAPEIASIPVGNSKLTKTALFAVIGAIVCYAVFFVKSMFDYRIHGENDLEDRFDYPLIAAIPSLGSDTKRPS